MIFSTKQTLITVLILVLIAIGGYYFLFDVIKSKNKKASLFSQEIELYSQRHSARLAKEKTAEELKEKIEKLESYFLHKDDIVPFIENIESVGKKSGADVSIVSVGVVGTPQAVQAGGTNQDKKDEVLSLRLDVRGKWDGVMNFVSYVENLPYKVSLDRVLFYKNSSIPLFFDTQNPSVNESTGSNTSEWTATIEMSVLTLK